MVISDSPNSDGVGIREKIVGESIVNSIYDLLSKKRYKKITGQDYPEVPSNLEKIAGEENTPSN